MTHLKDVFGQDMFKNMDKFLVGFDDSFSRMTKFHEDLTKNVPNYPPYNIKKTAWRTGHTKGQCARPRFNQQRIRVPVIAALELDNFVAAGEATS